MEKRLSMQDINGDIKKESCMKIYGGKNMNRQLNAQEEKKCVNDQQRKTN